MGTKNNTKVAFDALTGLALVAEFLGELYQRLPEGEARDAVKRVGLDICEGSNALLDQLEEDIDDEVIDVQPGNAFLDQQSGYEVLRNEVVNLAGLTFFASKALELIRDNSHDFVAANTAASACRVIDEVIESLPDVDDDEERGWEAVEAAQEFEDQARAYAEDAEDFTVDGIAA